MKVELPCKVGDMAYAVSEIEYKLQIVPYRINNLIIKENGEFYFENAFEKIYKFGFNIFTNKSEAERRLKELKGE